MPHQVITYRRAELYEKVWAEPIRTIAKRDGISDVGLAKVCRRLGIPVPGVGYWARKAAGQDLQRRPLPPAAEGTRDEVTVNRWLSDPARKVKVIQRRTAAEIEEQREREPVLAVSEMLTEPHQLVVTTRTRLFDRRPGSDGLIRRPDVRCLDVCVSPASLERALRLADALLKTCEQRQLQVEVVRLPPEERPGYQQRRPEDMPYVTRLLVDSEWVTLRLVERCREERDPPPKPPAHLKPGWVLDQWVREHGAAHRYIPNGALELSLASGTVSAKWRDYKRTKLETRLGEVVEHLSTIAAEVKRLRAEAEQRERAWQEQQRQRAEAERKAWEQQRQDEQIDKEVRRWRLAQDARECIADARRTVAEAGCRITPGGGLERWIERAVAYAERLDPHTDLRREVAGHMARREQVGDAPLQDVNLLARLHHAHRAELEEAIAARCRAQEIRAHVAAMRDVPTRYGVVLNEDGGLDRHLTWASAYADRIDPVELLRVDAERVAAQRIAGRESDGHAP